MLYLLQNCSAGYVGNSPMFWREGGSGYTPWIDEAKRWTKEEAEQQIRATCGTHSWAMWSVAEIEAKAKRTVDIQDLRKPLEESSIDRLNRAEQQKPKCQHKIRRVTNAEGQYERRCEKCGIEAHSDGDFSYMCGREYCRCMS